MNIQPRHLRALATVALAAAPDVEKSPLSEMVKDTRVVASPLYYMDDEDLAAVAETINEVIANRAAERQLDDAALPPRGVGSAGDVAALRTLASRMGRRAIAARPSPRDIRILADGLRVALDAIADLMERR